LSDLDKDLFYNPILDIVEVIEDFKEEKNIQISPIISLKRGEIVRVTKKTVMDGGKVKKKIYLVKIC
jgi:hypothetical protein